MEFFISKKRKKKQFKLSPYFWYGKEIDKDHILRHELTQKFTIKLSQSKTGSIDIEKKIHPTEIFSISEP